MGATRVRSDVQNSGHREKEFRINSAICLTYEHEEVVGERGQTSWFKRTLVKLCCCGIHLNRNEAVG